MRSTLLAALWLAGLGAAASPIDPNSMSETVKILASDAFQGRAPGTQGEAKTVDYLIGRFREAGLQPAGENGGWTQKVPLLKTQIGPDPLLAIGPLRLHQDQDIEISTRSPVDKIDIQDAPLVFVGYGVFAPERGWDDFKGVDLKGKVPVFLVNDPDFEAQPGEPVYGKFGGQAMTYYGRWTYKFEEAARRGAAAAIIIHETVPAAYGWSTVAAHQGEAYDRLRAADDPQPPPLEAWMQREVAVNLFKSAGLDFEALKKSARSPDFHPVPLGEAKFSATAQVSHMVVESHNVLGKIEGAKRPDESVVYGAHWDAYGIGADNAIRRGAADDGTGVAGVIEIAKLFAKGPKPQRSILFALWTAEEQNLLGSETYAAHPLFPLAKMAANYTLDTLETAGKSHDVVLVGAGQNSLEADLVKAAKKQHRSVTPDAHPEKGLFYRADHFSFAKRGVPTLLIMALGGAYDLVDGGREAGNRWVNDYTANCYHKACDAWSADWDLSGAAQDVELVYDMGKELANSKRWPNWSQSSEFIGIRQESNAARH